MTLAAIDKQIIWDRLIAVVEEQAQALLRTAFSTIVRECGDLSAGVFDTQGHMLTQAVTGTPGHVNSMAESVKHFLKAFPAETIQDGDVYITNDPWKGTGHLNDFVVTTPVFHGGQFVALFSCTSHLTDIGGIGFGPDATDIHMEGIFLPFLKIIEAGKLNQAIIDICKANTRNPVEMEGDIWSLIACNDVGAKRLKVTMEEFSLASLAEISSHIIDASRLAVCNELQKLPKGRFTGSMRVDGYDSPIDLVAAIELCDDKVIVDFTGTSPQQRRGINVPLSYTTAYTCFGLMCAISPKVPNNAGSLGVFEVKAPLGTILNAPYPAPVSSRHITGQMLPDVVFACLRQAIPERCPAEGTSCLWNLNFRGAQASGEHYMVTFTSNGGTGARPSGDGLNATAYPSGVKGTPVEIIEAMTPLVFWQKELRPNSGGEGRHRGGHGQLMEIGNRFGLEFELLAAFDRIDFPPRGTQGGANGACGSLSTTSGRTIKGKGFQIISGDDRLLAATPGGGGYGIPAQISADDLNREQQSGLLSNTQ